MPKKLEKNKDAEVHDELKGFDINIDAFGQLQTSFSIDKLNSFLDKNNDDKKVQDKDVE